MPIFIQLRILSYLCIWIDSKYIVWDSYVVFTVVSLDWLDLSLTTVLLKKEHKRFDSASWLD